MGILSTFTFVSDGSSRPTFEIQNVYAKNKRKKSNSTKDSHLVITFTDASEKTVSKAKNKRAKT